MAPLVEHSSLDFGSGRDLLVVRLSPPPPSGSPLSMEPAWASLSALPPTHVLKTKLKK